MKRLTSLFCLSALVLSLAACDVEKTEEGTMPEVNVEGGNMPEYDVETGDVDIEEKEVTVPTLDYESPDENAAEEGTGTR